MKTLFVLCAVLFSPFGIAGTISVEQKDSAIVTVSNDTISFTTMDANPATGHLHFLVGDRPVCAVSLALLKELNIDPVQLAVSAVDVDMEIVCLQKKDVTVALKLTYAPTLIPKRTKLSQ